MNLFIAVLTAVIALAALVTVWFALKASQESATATRYAKLAVDIAAGARDADVRWRQREQLQLIARLVQRIRIAASRASLNDYERTDSSWRSGEQDLLPALLLGVWPELPQCQALAGVTTTAKVEAAARDAEDEVRAAFRQVRFIQRAADLMPPVSELPDLPPE